MSHLAVSESATKESGIWCASSGNASTSSSILTSQPQGKEDEQKPQVSQASQSSATQSSTRPATASQILATIQNPARSRLAPVAKPTGLDPVAILRERESRYLRFQRNLLNFFKKLIIMLRLYSFNFLQLIGGENFTQKDTYKFL